MKYALLIAFLAGLFELVPFVGPFLSGALAVISALSTSTTLAIYTLIFFVIAEQFEANILVPVLNQQIVGLHPVIVIVALLIGAEVGGILGIVIAVPARRRVPGGHPGMVDKKAVGCDVAWRLLWIVFISRRRSIT